MNMRPLRVSSPRAILLAAAVAAVITVVCAQETSDSLCSCSYAVDPEAEDGCRVYGPIPNQATLQPWARADKLCLRAFENETAGIVSYDFKDYLEYCPYPNGTDFNPNGFRAFVQVAAATPTARLILSGYPEYFVLVNSSDETLGYRLKPNISSRTGDILDCVEEDDFCWQSITYNLEEDPREGQYVCSRAYPIMRQEMEAEQGKIRELICGTFSDDRPDECADLNQQVADIMNQYGSAVSCQDLARTSPINDTEIPPACDGPVPQPDNGGGGGTDSSTAAAVIQFGMTTGSAAVLGTMFALLF